MFSSGRYVKHWASGGVPREGEWENVVLSVMSLGSLINMERKTRQASF